MGNPPLQAVPSLLQGAALASSARGAEEIDGTLLPE